MRALSDSVLQKSLLCLSCLSSALALQWPLQRDILKVGYSSIIKGAVQLILVLLAIK